MVAARQGDKPTGDPLLVLREGGQVDGEHVYRRDIAITFSPVVREDAAEGDAGSMAPSSYDEERHEVDFGWGVGAPVVRRPWGDEPYVERLSMDPGHVVLDRANNGAPLLDSHQSWSIRDILGAAVPGSVRIENGQGVARIKLTRAEDASGAVQRIIEGTARNGSIGYRIHEAVETPANAETGAMREVLATKWEPYEFSATPMGADDSSGARAAGGQPAELPQAEGACCDDAERTMPNDDPTKSAESRSEGRAEALEMASQTATLLARHGMPTEMAAELLARDGITMEGVQSAVLKKLAEASDGRRSDNSVEVGADEHRKRASSMQDYLLHRIDPARNELTDSGRQWVGHSIAELLRSTLEARGVSTRGWSKSRLFSEGLQKRFDVYHESADFQLMLAAVMGKALRQMYEYMPATYTPFVSRTTVPDFKLQRRIQLGEMPDLLRVDESGEFQRGTFTEGQETYRIQTAGRIVGMTRQALVNDDLGGFGRIARGFVVKVAQYENDLVWGLITANANMADGNAIFSVAHANIIAPGAGGLYTSADIDATSLLMRLQTGLDGASQIRVEPKFLLCPEVQRHQWQQLFSPGYQPATAANTVTAQQRSIGDNIISDPLLDADSVLQWYLVADPMQIDFIEVAELAGEQGIFTETRTGFDVDGVEVKVRRDFGAGVLDHRGAARNAGA
jgi:hypothetical protein